MRARANSAPPAKGKLSRREHGDFAVGQNGLNAGDRFAESLQRGGFVSGMHQPGRYVAAIAAIHLDHRIVPLVKFEETPLGRRSIQVRHAFADQ
jgi:hypothetical protein